MKLPDLKKYTAEVIGTFALVFCGTGAIVIDQQSGGAVTSVGIALTFGLIVSSMIYALGDISGAHLNPAVSIAFWLANKFEARQLLPYIVSQLLGAFIASLTLKFLFPENSTLGATIPAGSNMQSFVLEIILSFILMLVILQVSSGSKEQGLYAGMAIGSVVLLEAMFAGPVCGASMNPARSMAPAFISGNTTQLWIYLLAPCLGMALATAIFRFLKQAS